MIEGNPYREPMPRAPAAPRGRIGASVWLDIAGWLFWLPALPLLFLFAFDDTGGLRDSLYMPWLPGMILFPLGAYFLAYPPAFAILSLAERSSRWWTRDDPPARSPVVGGIARTAANLRRLLRVWSTVMSVGEAVMIADLVVSSLRRR